MIGFSGKASTADLRGTGGLSSTWSKSESCVCRGEKLEQPWETQATPEQGRLAGLSGNKWVKQCVVSPDAQKDKQTAPGRTELGGGVHWIQMGTHLRLELFIRDDKGQENGGAGGRSV